MNIKDLKLKLLYYASIHGFKSTTFYEMCDNKGKTLVIV